MAIWNLPVAGRLALLLAVALLPVPGESALRCGSRLVSEGDSMLEVLHKCGQPDLVRQRPVWRTVRGLHLAPHIEREVVVQIDIEEWTYNLGPQRFMRLVRFANGEVIEVRSLGYGFSNQARP